MSGNLTPWKLDNGYEFYHISRRTFLGKRYYTCTTLNGDPICEGAASNLTTEEYTQHVKSHVHLALYGNQPEGPGAG